MQEITITGHLGADAEVKQGTTTQYLRFSAAVQGRKDTPATWYSVIVTGDYERIRPYLKKGAKVFVRGRFDGRIYLDKEQKPHLALDIYTYPGNIEILKFAGDGAPAETGNPFGTPQPSVSDSGLPF